MTSTPLISFVIAARDAERTVGQAIGSALGQTVRDLEVVVIDDGSIDRTAEVVSSFDDARVTLLRNDESEGLAASLNSGIERARGRWIARLDADDVALPTRLELQLARANRGDVGIVGGAVVEIDLDGRLGAIHHMPSGRAAVGWRALFAPPFFHPAVLLDRELMLQHDLRYDPGFERTQDFDLWTRMLEVTEGDNVFEPVVLYRGHPGQVSTTDGGAQRARQREVGTRSILGLAPSLGEVGAGLAWELGSGGAVPSDQADDAARAVRELWRAFARGHRHARGLGSARRDVGRTLVRNAVGARRVGLLREALLVAPSLIPEVPVTRLKRRRARRAAHDEARRVLRRLGDDGRPGPVRVTVVSPEPTPYRSALFDGIARRPELELSVVYAAETVASRAWTVAAQHTAISLRGIRFPGARRVLRHDYPVTPGIFRALATQRPDVVVVSGWSTFASQASYAWSRRKRVPYLLISESNDVDARSGWRKAVKRLVVPRFTRNAETVLVVGELTRRSMLARGVPPERIAVFANTIDVPAWGAEAARLADDRDALRAAFGATDKDVVVLSVARLSPEKGLSTLIEAAAGDPRLLVVVAGDGPERAALKEHAAQFSVRLELVGNLEHARLIEAYAAADVFALLSSHEPWGVVVNEAAACGLPLLLSDRVGAAADLLVDGENGALVRTADPAAAMKALERFVAEPEWRRQAGDRSRELVSGWGYEPSIENFVGAALAAAGK